MLNRRLYSAGRHCERRLWLEVNKPIEVERKPSAVREFSRQVRRELYVRAKALVPDAISIGHYGSTREAIEATRLAMEEGAQVINDPVFSDGSHMTVHLDQIVRLANGSWEVREIKQGGSAKRPYKNDIAMLVAVVRRAGVEVSKATLIHVNKDCEYPNLDELFEVVDVTEDIESMELDFDAEIEHLAGIPDGTEPEIRIGTHCGGAGRPCPMRGHCWTGVDRPTIYLIPHLKGPRLAGLEETDILYIDDVPEGYEFTRLQQEVVDVAVSGIPSVDRPRLRERLDELVFPLYFLDFETDGPVVPRFGGMRPFGNLPFQFSCHVLHENGQEQHLEFLHRTTDDPRQPFTEALLEAVGESGSVVVYADSFEKSVIKSLAAEFPIYERALLAVNERMWDLEKVIKTNIEHPGFLGTSSLKTVLPVLCPGLSYDDMLISDGKEAPAYWNYMLNAESEEERAFIEQGILDYCKMDTFAMVALRDALIRLSQPERPSVVKQGELF